MASKPKHPYTIVRGGKLLDIAKRKAAPADILIKGDTIAEIGRPGLAAPAGAAVIDATQPADASRPDQRPHPQSRQPRQGHGRSVVARAAADGQPMDRLGPHARGQVPVGHDRRGRDGDEGLHRGLRSRRRVPAAVGRRPVGHGQGLRGSRHARRAGAHGGRHHLLRGHSRPDGAAVAGAAEGGRELPLRAVEGDHQADEQGAAEVAVREGRAGRGADHPAPLQRRLPDRLPRPRARVRRRHPQPRRRIEGPGRGGLQALRHLARRPHGRARPGQRAASPSPTACGSTTRT